MDTIDPFPHLDDATTPTPLLDISALASHVGVARVRVKLENLRASGHFKILGGRVAVLRALARATGIAERALLDRTHGASVLPALLCASEGNHGLAVATVAARVGTTATIFLPHDVDARRVARIRALGASIVGVDGGYDDAVACAAEAARRGEGLLVADTSRDPDDVVVHDVMLGYARIADELERQFAQDPWPTHVFVQAGVGGLAAAMAQGLVPRMRAPARCVVVEPERAACVGLALALGSASRLAHDPVGVASMLACGEASAPAIRILLRHAAQAVAVDDATLREAETLMADAGIATTTSGAAGFAGLLHVARGPVRREAHALDARADVILLVTEGPLPAA